MKPIEKLIAHFGSQDKTAEAIGVSQATVSYWLSGTNSMRAKHAFKAEELTGGLVTARDLCSRDQQAQSAA